MAASTIAPSTVRRARAARRALGATAACLWAGLAPLAAPLAAQRADPPRANAPSSARGPTDPRELERFVDSVVAAEMTKQHIPGAVVAFVKDGRVFWSKGYGVADLETKRPVDPERTIWRIGSISKVFTATAVVQLADRGRLDLHADVNRYLTRLQVPATVPQPITAAHLITHTAALDEIRPGTQGPDSASVLPLAEFLRPRLVRNGPPGRVVAYSTYGITLAGLLVEEVSGQPYEQYLATHLWRPLGMTRTSITVPRDWREDVAVGYEYQDGAHRAQRWEWYHTTPASSINATAADMARWLLAHLALGRAPDGGARVLSERAARDMQRRQAGGHPRIAGFAYGWNENTDPGYPRYLDHGGNMAGFSTEALLIPEHDAGFFVANHGEGTSLREVLKWALLDRYYRDPTRPPPPPPPAAGAAERVRQVAGRYGWVTYCHSCPGGRPYSVLEVTANPDGTIGANGRRWVEVGPLLFLREDGQARIGFQADDAGRVTHLLAGGFWVFERLAAR